MNEIPLLGFCASDFQRVLKIMTVIMRKNDHSRSYVLKISSSYPKCTCICHSHIRINFMKEFYTRNEIIDSGPLDTNNTIIKLLRGEYKIDYANIGKFLAHILEVSSELLRQTEAEQSG